MKKLILVPVVLLLTSCISMVPKEELGIWALSNGYVLASSIPKVVVPERLALPHPDVPTIQVRDADGNYIKITQTYLMKIIVSLFGTVEKFQYLAEIYEREYLNAGGKIMPDVSLNELKEIYLQRIQDSNITTAGRYPTTGSTTNPVEFEMTIENFAILVDAFNYFQVIDEEVK